ncbi:MAG: relaxase/mobilization nuclease domain-containing protein [Opitutales bacterium]|nr:relaxase/mobilization nuclease domain-containing protein [Opitutales bacterium]
MKPIILAGDQMIMRDLLQKSNFKESCTGGCLAFGEIIPDRNVLKEIIASYEDYTLAGLNKDDIQRIWILHEDKNKTEVHFVFANLHLTSGRRYAHYLVQAGDFAGIDAWQFTVNEKYNLRNPLDEKYKRFDAQPINNLPRRKSEIKNKIDEIITAQIIARRIQDRNDIVLFLESGGFEVRQTRTGISIREIGSEEKFLRLKGGKYEHGWTGTTHKKSVGNGDQDDQGSGRRRYKVKSLEEYERILADSKAKRAARQAKVHNTPCARTRLFSHVEPDIQELSGTKTGTKTGTDPDAELTVGIRDQRNVRSTREDDTGESRDQETIESTNSGIIPVKEGKQYGRTNHGNGGESGTKNPDARKLDDESRRAYQLARECEEKSRLLGNAAKRDAETIENLAIGFAEFSDNVRQREELKEPKEEPIKTKSSLQVEPYKFTVREFRQTFRKKNGYCVVEFRNGKAWVVQWFEEMPAGAVAQGKFLEGEGRLFKAVDGAWVQVQKGKSSVKGKDK